MPDGSAEYNVGVSFYGDDFVVTVLWSTSATADNEVRALAASEWFLEKYGFDLAQHTRRSEVSPVPDLEKK